MSNVTLRKIGPVDWGFIADDVMALEYRLFGGTPLCEEFDDYTEAFTDPRSVAYAAWVDNQFAGFIVGIPCETVIQDYTDEEGKPLYHIDKIGANSIYVTATEVAPEFAGKGLGTLLKKNFIQEAVKKGYESVSGHARISTGSAHVTEKFKPQIKEICPDYWGTGESYMFYVIDLNHVNRQV